tara:strand:- start:952 stop:1191 length:240 start_codon:yes stop_codon:yes gene_type:complete
MEKRKKVKTVGAGVVIGAAILGGIVAYRNRKAIKRKKDRTQDNITQWKNLKVRSALDTAENVIKDLRYSTITEKDIAWG